MENDINLSFCISSYDDITHEDITKALDLIPYKTYVRGMKIHPNNEKLSNFNKWVYGTPYQNPDSFQEQMDKILDVLEPRIPILKEYAEKYECEFSLALFLFSREESTPWVHFDKRYNAFIREVDAEFDIDIYYPPEDEEE